MRGFGAAERSPWRRGRPAEHRRRGKGGHLSVTLSSLPRAPRRRYHGLPPGMIFGRRTCRHVAVLGRRRRLLGLSRQLVPSQFCLLVLDADGPVADAPAQPIQPQAQPQLSSPSPTAATACRIAPPRPAIRSVLLPNTTPAPGPSGGRAHVKVSRLPRHHRILGIVLRQVMAQKCVGFLITPDFLQPHFLDQTVLFASRALVDDATSTSLAT